MLAHLSVYTEAGRAGDRLSYGTLANGFYLEFSYPVTFAFKSNLKISKPLPSGEFWARENVIGGSLLTTVTLGYLDPGGSAHSRGHLEFSEE